MLQSNIFDFNQILRAAHIPLLSDTAAPSSKYSKERCNLQWRQVYQQGGQSLTEPHRHNRITH